MNRRQTKDPTIAWLQEHPWWGELSADELRHLASFGERLDLPADRLIMLEGERGIEAALIIEGEVMVTRPGQVLAWVGPGEIVGELSILDEAPRNASVRTASAVQLLVLRDRDLRSAIEEIAPLRARVLELAAQHRGARAVEPPA